MKKHYIWQNTDINIDEWRDGYLEFCDFNNITPGDDYALLEWATDTNFLYLDDENENLNKTIDGDIIVIADLGRWNGRVNGYKICNNNLNAILNVNDPYFEIYGDGRDIVAVGNHHDGTNYYIFRAIRPDRNIDNFLSAIYNNEPISRAKLNYYTRSIYNDVANIYGW